MENEQPGAPESRPGELLAFFVRRETKCADCYEALHRGTMITLEKARGALCLECADLDHLEYLPRGNAALTRRAKKHSQLKAIVLEWSRTRQHYERQGILVESDALETAERECLGDEDFRARQRERRRVREGELDRQYLADFAEQIRALYPCCPEVEADGIAMHACRKYSGRVGRSAAAKEFDPEAIRLAVAAAIRHRFTNYDELLLCGRDRYEARAMVRGAVEDRLREWRGERGEAMTSV